MAPSLTASVMGYTELQSITDAVNEGAIYRFLTIPWDDERLRVHVQEAFSQKGMADENRRLALEVREANEELAVLNGRLERVLSNQQMQLGLEASRATAARDMLELLPVPAFGIDPQGLMVMANLAAQQLLGAERLLLGQCAACAAGPAVGAAGRAGAGFRMVRSALACPRPTFWCICPQGAFAGVQRIGLTIHARTDPDPC